MPKRTIRAQTIMTLLKHVIDPTDSRTIAWNFDIRGGPPAVRALFKPLNESDEFKGYGLDLKPDDFAGAKSIADVGGVIIHWFETHDYKVIV